MFQVKTLQPGHLLIVSSGRSLQTSPAQQACVNASIVEFPASWKRGWKNLYSSYLVLVKRMISWKKPVEVMTFDLVMPNYIR